MILSIIIPVFNEVSTVADLIERVASVKLFSGLQKEILVVDDGSFDGTKEVLSKYESKDSMKIFYHDENKGKTEAVKTGIKHMTGDIVLIQDADLEYDPQYYNALLKPIINDGAHVVYGSRWKGSLSGMAPINYLANITMSFTANVLFGANLSDVTTCYKVFKKEILQQIPIRSNRFSFCGEVTGYLLKNKIPIHEVPIHYIARSKKEGKKIGWIDGVCNYWEMIKYRFIN